MRGFLYLSGYNAVCEALHMDAAPGRRSIGNAGACGNSLAKASRNAEATADLFLLSTRQYLATAGARACSVTCHAPGFCEYDLGFRTRRHGDFLYVTEAAQETRLAPGMRIVAVGKNTISFLLKDTGAEVFWGRGTDREDWDLVLRMYDDIDVFPGDGHVMRLDLRRYPVVERTRVMAAEVCEARDGSRAVVARVDTLADEEALDTLVGQVQELLMTPDVSRLVIDLRHCATGASATAYLRLLPFLVDHDILAREVMGETELFTIYSKNNAERLIAGIESARKSLNPAEASIADQLVEAIHAKAEEVLAAKRTTHVMAERLLMSELPEVMPSPFTDELVHVAKGLPDRVVLLVDTTTGVGAERLAESVMGMGRVRLVGRSTPGLVDYANYMAYELEGIDCTFVYPISRTKANHDGAGYERRGLPLDVHVPFEPAECEADVIMRAALGL